MDFIFPLNITVSAMYRRWHVGQNWEEPGTRRKVWIRPLRFLHRLPFSMDVTDENTRKYIGKANLVMSELDQICREEGILGETEEVGLENHARCYAEGFRKLVSNAFGEDAWKRRKTMKRHGKKVETAEDKRYFEYSYISFYNPLCDQKRARRKQIEEEGTGNSNSGSA
eukprot:130001-Hanusia_phi.AAC.1